jgi:hypothetical protein
MWFLTWPTSEEGFGKDVFQHVQHISHITHNNITQTFAAFKDNTRLNVF